MLNQDIIREATRLTRAGQLVEATALLQRMLRGERAPDALHGDLVVADHRDEQRERVGSNQLIRRCVARGA